MPKSNFNWNPYAGHRVLVEPNPDQDKHEPGPREFAVIGASPSGTHVKFKNVRGSPFWCPHDEYVLLEDLGLEGVQ